MPSNGGLAEFQTRSPAVTLGMGAPSPGPSIPFRPKTPAIRPDVLAMTLSSSHDYAPYEAIQGYGSTAAGMKHEANLSHCVGYGP
jgi:hypothetical protein